MKSPNKAAVCIHCGYVEPAAVAAQELANPSQPTTAAAPGHVAAPNLEVMKSTVLQASEQALGGTVVQPQAKASAAPPAGSIVAPPPGVQLDALVPMEAPETEPSQAAKSLELTDVPRVAKDFAGDIRSETQDLWQSKEGLLIRLALKIVIGLLVFAVVAIILMVFVLQ